MNLLLCSDNSDLISRWSTILAAYSIERSISITQVQKLLHTNRENRCVLLLHDNIAPREDIGKCILQRPTGCSILVGSNNPNDQDGITYLQYGANGYTNCYASPSRLCQAIQTISNNGVWFRQSLMRKLIGGIGRHEKQKTPNDPLQTLSARQKEVAVFISEGLSNKQIGEALFISENTVKVHLYSIFKKLNIKGRLALALLIKGNGGE